MLAYDKEGWRSSVQNGKIAPFKLDKIYPEQFDRDLGGPALMHPEAAAAMSTLLQAAAEQGFGDLAVSLSYRTLAKQQEKWKDFQNGGNLAAIPGTSNHGWAVSCDMRWGRLVTLQWLQKNARKYGFVNDVPSENWHYTYQEGLWDGDDVTEGQLEMLKEASQFVRGAIAFDEKWTKENPNPDTPKDKEPFWTKGFNIIKRAYNRPKTP